MDLSLEYLVRKPKSNIEKPPLLIMLHGYGSNEQDLFSFADELPDELLIISARAPLNMAYGGYAWYTIHFDSTDGKFSDTDEAIKSREIISKFIDEILEKYDVNPKKVFLLGFSQGTILSYAVALNYPEKVQYVVGLSGYINRELLPKIIYKEDYKNLEIYSSHGSVDQVIPVEWARKTKPFLDKLNIKNSYEEYQVGHGVAPQNFHSLKQWIEERSLTRN
ncbi:alpha/beta hydrolase-fold protein [Aureibaculum sp. 2210JD6-5]|uniref:alpha/beta hydrolase n=1 Tax=Aureibaculum sp. 2210JD6-5 TaxID=3103957 RepID=UPI002AADB491|nr:alpha/beta hydrolase-fold protein [Aureibaculum sp. 2210JD6-5]MDY7395609.1 alpha/beta hydrolase-fold protein [Aureibaculum sp. 2210JD6-5]